MHEGYQQESIRRLSRLRRVTYQYSRGHHPHPYLKLDCQNITNHQILYNFDSLPSTLVPATTGSTCSDANHAKSTSAALVAIYPQTSNLVPPHFFSTFLDRLSSTSFNFNPPLSIIFIVR